MTTRSEVVAFLPGNLFTLVGDESVFGVQAQNIYFRERTRYKRQGTEILLTYGGRSVVRMITGRLVTYGFDLELFVATPDALSNASTTVEEKMERTAKLIVDNYDNKPGVFHSTITDLIDSVRCMERTSVDIASPTSDDNRWRYNQHLALEISVWEA